MIGATPLSATDTCVGRAPEAVITKKYISQERVREAQARYATKARYAKIRCWIGFAVKVALGAADTYVLLSPFITGKSVNPPEPVGWGQWTKQLLAGVGVAVAKTLVSEMVKEQAEPLLAQFREKNYVPITRCWFLQMPGPSHYVALTHEMLLFIELLQLLDTSVLMIMRNDVAQTRRHEAVIAVAATAEKILGHIRYAQAGMMQDNMISAAIADGIAQRFEKLIEEFCTATEAMSIAENKTKLATLCATCMNEYQAELLLLRSVPAYALELW
jgi:hypothetical protein